MNFLGTILRETRETIEERKRRVPLDRVKERPLYARTPLSLSSALRKKSPAVIAEVKKASPSKGVICPDFDPARTARQYEEAGAAAISVLTEEKHFLGSLDDLESVRGAVAVPLLRKDFILDAYQVHEAKSRGADAVLLIAAALSHDDMARLLGEVEGAGLEALVEIHTHAEIESLAGLPVSLVGINNRNLATFETDIAVSGDLARALPPGVLAVSESGIRTGEDIRSLRGFGIRAFLIGEHLMRSSNPGEALAELIKDAGSKQ